MKKNWIPVLFDQTSHILIRRREEVNSCTLAANSGSKEPEPQFGKKGERNENESGPRFKKLPPSLSMPTKSISHPHPNFSPPSRFSHSFHSLAATLPGKGREIESR